MKNLMFAVALLFSATAFAQNATEKTPASLVKFKEITYDFGKIKQGVPVTHDFVFSNVSDKQVIVESANASCGCTTPKWPEQPVAKGKTEKITAGFNAQAVGPFNKSIYVKLAGVEQPMEIKISGEVLTADDYAKYEKEKGTKPARSGGK